MSGPSGCWASMHRSAGGWTSSGCRPEILHAVAERTAQDGIVVGDRVLYLDSHAVVHDGRALGDVLVLRDRTDLIALAERLETVRAMTSALRVQRHEFANRLHVATGLIDARRPDEARAFLAEQLGRGPVDFPVDGLERVEDPLLQSFLGAKAMEAGERGVALHIADDTLLHGTLVGAEDVAAVVGNLLDNAFTAAVRGDEPREVEVALLDDGDALVVTVADSGPGIEEGRDVFAARLQRRTASGCRARTRTGSAPLARARPPPRRRCVGHRDEARRRRRRLRRAATGGHVPPRRRDRAVSAGIRVLVVDDDFRVAGLHRDIVASRPGFTALEPVGSLGRARAAIRDGDPDLLLVDAYLPDGDGVGLIRESERDAVMLSAAGDSPTIRRALRAGAFGYLIKPFEARALGDLLDRYARFRNLLSGDKALSQVELDRALSILHGGEAPSLSRSATEQLILESLGDEDASASDVADRAGVSRATAQRHLAALAARGMIEVKLRYGTTGRPEHRYRQK